MLCDRGSAANPNLLVSGEQRKRMTAMIWFASCCGKRSQSLHTQGSTLQAESPVSDHIVSTQPKPDLTQRTMTSNLQSLNVSIVALTSCIKPRALTTPTEVPSSRMTWFGGSNEKAMSMPIPSSTMNTMYTAGGQPELDSIYNVSSNHDRALPF